MLNFAHGAAFLRTLLLYGNSTSAKAYGCVLVLVIVSCSLLLSCETHCVMLIAVMVQTFAHTHVRQQGAVISGQ